MKTMIRRTAVMLAAIFLMTGGSFALVAGADAESDFANLLARWSEHASDEHRAIVEVMDDTVLSDLDYAIQNIGHAVFFEAIYRKADMKHEGFSQEEEAYLVKLKALSMGQLNALYSIWYFAYEEKEENKQNETNDKDKKDDEHEAAEHKAETLANAGLFTQFAEAPVCLSDYLMSKIGQGNEQEQKELAEWFLSLSTNDQSAAMTDLANTLSEEEYEEFRTWFMEAYLANCSSESEGAVDTLNLHGNDWAALTLHGLPAPAQGKLQQSASVDNKRTGRKVVLTQVEQATLENWLAEISDGNEVASEDYSLKEQPDHDGSAFDTNFGPSSTAAQDAAGGICTTYFVSADDGDEATNPTEVKIEYNPAEKTLTISVLDP